MALEDLEVGGIDDLKGERKLEIAEGRLEILVIEGILEVRGFIILFEGELMDLEDWGVGG